MSNRNRFLIRQRIGYNALFILLCIFSSSSAQFVQLYQKDGAVSGNQFGTSIAKVGDVNNDGTTDFIVGAPYADPAGLTDAGSAFVYSGADGTLLYAKHGSSTGEFFGFSVAGVGDANGDGKTDEIIIGARRADPSGRNNAGAAYVYSGPTGNLLYTVTGGTAGDEFGYSVAGAGDVNWDGKADFIVGAPFAHPCCAEYDGSAYVYSGATGGLLYQKDGYPGSDGNFGASVASAGDVDGDNRADFIVGAPLDNLGVPGYFFGTAWVFSGINGATLLEIQGANPGDFMGISVGSAGDVNKPDDEGKGEVIVGATGAEVPGLPTNTGVAYVMSVSPYALRYTKAGTATGDGFGNSVGSVGDINGDGKSDFIVGAHTANPSGVTDAGSVFLYSGANGSLHFQANGSAINQRFGYSVNGGSFANMRGKNHFVVGAPLSDPGGLNDAGSAFVFNDIPKVALVAPDGGEDWGIGITQTVFWTASDPDGIASVDIRLDRDNDGNFDELIATVPGTQTIYYFYYWPVTGPTTNSAKIQVIPRDSFTTSSNDVSNSTFNIIQLLNLSLLFQKDGAAGGEPYTGFYNFGTSVANAGDVNGDGKSDFIIGAPYADPNGIGSAGSAFVYSGVTRSLLYRVNGSVVSQNLGLSVAGVGDVNGDGKGDFIVGAPYPTAHADSAFVYSGATGTSLYRLGLADAGDFGTSVAGIGDVNGDGRPDFIIGAPFAGSGGFTTGSAFIYSGINSALLYRKDGAAGADYFGQSVAGAGDVNGDGKADFIIGAFGTDSAGLDAQGSAYVYSGVNGTLLYHKKGTIHGSQFGRSVAGTADINGDGRGDFIVGAPTEKFAEWAFVGSAYLYSGVDGSLLYQKKGAIRYDNFGWSVSGAGDVNGDGRADFVIGADNTAPNGLLGAGSIYIYSGTTGSLIFQKDGASAYDNFGQSVSSVGEISGDGKADVIVGAPDADPGGLSYAGSAYVYGFPDLTLPSVTVTSPNGGEYVSLPCPYFTIEWNATDNVGVSGIEIRLDRTNNGDFEEQIALLAGNPGSYDWDAGGSPSGTAKIKVIATDAAGNVGSDVSNGTFTIGQYCYLRPLTGFDINKDGILSLVDVALVINSVRTETDESSIDLIKKQIESMLIAIF